MIYFISFRYATEFKKNEYITVKQFSKTGYQPEQGGENDNSRKGSVHSSGEQEYLLSSSDGMQQGDEKENDEHLLNFAEFPKETLWMVPIIAETPEQLYKEIDACTDGLREVALCEHTGTPESGQTERLFALCKQRVVDVERRMSAAQRLFEEGKGPSTNKKYPHRCYAVGRTAQELLASFKCALDNERNAGKKKGIFARAHKQAALRGLVCHQAEPRDDNRVCAVFCGQGPQWPLMGRESRVKLRAYRRAFDQLLPLVAPYCEGFDLEAEMNLVSFDGSHMDETCVAQPALFLTQCCIAKTLRALGVALGGTIGHSLGEVAAAATAGVLTPSDAGKLVAFRGRTMQDNVKDCDGRMVAVMAPASVVEPLLVGHPNCAIACYNAPNACVLSGDLAALEEIESRLAAYRTLVIGTEAFHSPLLDSAVPVLKRRFDTLSFRPPCLDFYSTALGTKCLWTGSKYWSEQPRHAVHLCAAIEAAAADGYSYFVEVAPNPAVVSFIPADMGGRPCTAVSTFLKHEPEVDTLLCHVLQLWALGGRVDLVRLLDGQRAPPTTSPKLVSAKDARFSADYSYSSAPFKSPCSTIPFEGAERREGERTTSPADSFRPVSPSRSGLRIGSGGGGGGNDGCGGEGKLSVSPPGENALLALPSEAPPTADEIKAFVKREMSALMHTDVSSISDGVAIPEYGLESLDSLRLVTKLSAFVGAPVSPYCLLAADATVAHLSEQLAALAAARHGVSGTQRDGAAGTGSGSGGGGGGGEGTGEDGVNAELRRMMAGEVNLLSEQVALPRLLRERLKGAELSVLYDSAHALDNSATFHTLCDGYSPTIALFSTRNGEYISGYYTRAVWKSVDGKVKDSKALAFCLRSPEYREPQEFPIALFHPAIKNSSATFSTFCGLTVPEQFLSTPAHAVIDPSFPSLQSPSKLWGTETFLIGRMIVFQVLETTN